MTASSPAASQTDHPAAAIAGDAPTVIEIRDLHKAYGSLEVLKGVSISARRGDVVSLIGSSGSGKSTVLKLIMRSYDPSAGAISGVHSGPRIRAPG